MHLEEFAFSIRRLCTSVRRRWDHEFSTISGVVEDVTEIILNLKQVRFKRQIEDIDNEAVISVSGKDQLTAGDFQNHFRFPSFESRTVICNLDPKSNWNFDLTIEKVEICSAKKKKKQNAAIGTIFTDPILLR
jgi:DNA-directed RNA polymerase subunit alpha